MICSNCKFQWCCLCEGKYEYGHYNQGKCKGIQFSRVRNFEEANRISFIEKMTDVVIFFVNSLLNAPFFVNINMLIFWMY
jgi:hypothetical protein